MVTKQSIPSQPLKPDSGDLLSVVYLAGSTGAGPQLMEIFSVKDLPENIAWVVASHGEVFEALSSATQGRWVEKVSVGRWKRLVAKKIFVVDPECDLYLNRRGQKNSSVGLLASNKS